jgi:hypothetical protein
VGSGGVAIAACELVKCAADVAVLH